MHEPDNDRFVESKKGRAYVTSFSLFEGALLGEFQLH